MDPHIFADPDSDSGSHNLADPTDPDPDPKYWSNVFFLYNPFNVNKTFEKSFTFDCNDSISNMII